MAAAAPSSQVRMGTHEGRVAGQAPTAGQRWLDLTPDGETPKPTGSPRLRRHRNHARVGGASGDRAGDTREIAAQRLTVKMQCVVCSMCLTHAWPRTGTATAADTAMTKERRTAGKDGGTQPAECLHLAAPARHP